MKYHILEVFYKHGAYSIKTFNTENETKLYLNHYLLNIHKAKTEDSSSDEDFSPDLSNYTFNDIITKALKAGEWAIKNSSDYGVVAVFFGSIL